MIKRIIVAIMVLVPMLVQAEMWKEHAQFINSSIKNNIDAPECVYMLVNNKLNRFDKTSGEIQMMTSSKGLTEDINVQQIYYNYDKQFLLVLYVNSDIDIIKNDGTIVNVPALKNMILQGCDKTVNDVTFGYGLAYVSTGFGYLTIDDNTLETREYRNYGTSIRSMIQVGNGLVAAMGDSLYYSNTLHPRTLGSFSSLAHLGGTTAVTIAKLFNINDTRFFLTTTSDKTYVKRMEIQVEEDSVALTEYQYSNTFTKAQPLLNIQPTSTGFLWNVLLTNKTYYTTNTVGENYKSVNGARNGIYSCYPAGNGQLWGLGADGLFNNSASSVLYTTNAIRIVCPYWASYNPNNGKLYVTRTAATPTITSYSSGLLGAGFMTYDGEIWRSEGYTWSSTGPAAMKTAHEGWRPVFDLREPNAYYLGTWYCGGVKVVNDTVVAVYDERNSTVLPSKNSYYRCVHGYGFDSQHNFWMVQSMDASLHNEEFQNAAMVLPADKLALNNDVTIDDWYSYYIPNTTQITSSTFNSFVIGKDDIKVYTPGNGGANNNYLIFWRGELTGEQETKQHNTVVDQYGASLGCGLNPVLAADSTGMIWVGGSGVFYLDPTTAFDETLNVIRPRNSAGAIILEGIGVIHIEVDYLNRKWVSTNGNGVYLLSPDGTEILKHFDNDNSILPSPLVYSTCAMGNTGRVMIMTANGVVEYLENDDPEIVEVIGDLEVYPALVTPGFTGLVTISGVVTGRQVRIDNKQGNTVALLTSANNVATWDCCDENGERVATGTYDIYIATPDNEMPDEPQLTVKVIK